MVTKLENDWGKFFKSGFYHTVWSSVRTASQDTVTEVAGVLNILKPATGSHILDWCGGWGRHSVALSQKGYKLTLLDFAPNHIKKAKRLAKLAAIKMNFVCADFRNTPQNIQADFAVNLFTSGIGYLEEKDDVAALKSLYFAIKPNAKILIDTMNFTWLIKNYVETGDQLSDDGKIRVVVKRRFNHISSRVIEENILLYKDGRWKSHVVNHRIYSVYELNKILTMSGFKIVELYGGFDASPFNFDSRRILVVCEKVNN